MNSIEHIIDSSSGTPRTNFENQLSSSAESTTTAVAISAIKTKTASEIDEGQSKSNPSKIVTYENVVGCSTAEDQISTTPATSTTQIAISAMTANRIYETDSAQKASDDKDIAFEKQTRRLITSDMSDDLRSTIVNAISSIDPSHLEECVNQTLRLMTPNMNEYAKSAIIHALAKIDPNQREECVNQTLQLMTPDMVAYQVIRIIHSVTNICSSKRDLFEKQISLLITPDMGGFEKSMIMDELAKIDLNQRDVFGKQVLQCLNQEKINNGCDRVWTVLALLSVTPTYIDEFLKLTQKLITPDMSKKEKSVIFHILSKMNPNVREKFVNQTLRLITQNMAGYRKFRIIQTLSETDLTHLEEVVNHTLRFIMPDMNERERLDIGRAVYFIHPNNREQRVERAANQFAQDAAFLDPEERLDRIIVLLETPLDRPFPPLGNHMAELAVNGMADGVNVHHNGRDQRTRSALELLRANTKTLIDDEMELGNSLFLSYLDSFSDLTVRENARFALNGQSRSPQDFPALLGDPTFTIAGLEFSGSELIGRLWHFIEQFNDPHAEDLDLERENAKTSMIQALSDCFNESGHRVCNPGKVQRLVVSVLQGRLEGVNVDNLVMNDVVEVSIADAFRMFFNDEIRTFHQEVDQLDEERAKTRLKEILEKAELFCDENPNVNREEFLEEIRRALNIT